MNRKNLYLLLCVLGIAIPYSQFIPWVAQNGVPLGLLIRLLFANQVSAFFGMDVLVSSAVLIVFMRIESRRVAIAHRWVALLGLCLVGVSLGLPLFLYLRERALEVSGSADYRGVAPA